MSGPLARRRARLAAGESTGNFWPGYVDALTNVVLNLLFLVSILTAAVFSLGMEHSRQKIRPSGVPQPDRPPLSLRNLHGPSVTILDAGVVAFPPRPLRQFDASAGLERKAVQAVPAAVVAVETVVPGRTFALRFATGAFAMGAAEPLPLDSAHWARIRGASRIAVFAWAASGDREAQRVAFMRTLSVRDHLRAAGIASNSIDCRLVPGRTGSGTIDKVYIVLTSGNDHGTDAAE